MKSTPKGNKVVVANSGANRQQQRNQSKKKKSGDKPMYMRIIVLGVVVVMFLGYIFLALMRAF